jgi:hypothetical protein
MIFDLNEDYLRSKVLPRLVGEYLNPAGEVAYDVSVSAGGPHDPVIFSTRSDKSSVAAGADATAEIFSGEMGSASGPGPGRGHGRFHDDPRSSRWMIAVRHRAGSLEIAVEHARIRNLPPPLWSATACSPGNRHCHASAERCGQPRIRDSVRPSIPLRGTDALAGSYGARSNRAESDRSACAPRKSSRSSGAGLTDEYARLWSHGSRLAFNCGTSAGATAIAIVRATAWLPKRYILAFSLRTVRNLSLPGPR